MQISPLSFGKRIPINECKILDTNRNRLVGATFCEYDCKDILDVCEIGELAETWTFKELIALRMLEKFKCHEEGQQPSNEHFYSIVDCWNKIAGICYSKETEDEITINMISCDNDKKYKYVGSSIIASLGKKLIENNGKTLKIQSPISDAYGFYEKCGFKHFESKGDVFSKSCEMPKSEVADFLERFEEKIWMILFGL